MNIPETNAFTINRLGSAFFPLSLNVTRQGELSSAFFCAQRLIDLCDLIEWAGLENLTVFAVDQTSHFDENTQALLPLAEIAATVPVAFTALDADTIVLATEEFKPLLSNLCHNNLLAFDLGKNWDENLATGQVLTCLEHDWHAAELILAKLPASRLFIASHDDCYLTVQTANPLLIQRIFARMLQTYAGTILAENHPAPVFVAEIGSDVLDHFWGDEFGLTILREATTLDASGLKIGVCRKAFSFRESGEYPPEFWLRYAIQAQTWSLE